MVFCRIRRLFSWSSGVRTSFDRCVVFLKEKDLLPCAFRYPFVRNSPQRVSVESSSSVEAALPWIVALLWKAIRNLKKYISRGIYKRKGQSLHECIPGSVGKSGEAGWSWMKLTGIYDKRKRPEVEWVYSRFCGKILVKLDEVDLYIYTTKGKNKYIIYKLFGGCMGKKRNWKLTGKREEFIVEDEFRLRVSLNLITHMTR